MDLKKNINRYLTILLGIATILIYVLIGVLIFRKDLLFPKVQASPATCTVNDSLDVSGTIRAMDIFSAGGLNVVIGDDTFLTDVDVANMLGIYGVQNSDRAGIRLGSDGSLIFGDNGNVGIGTTSPGARLDVNGNLSVNGNINIVPQSGTCIWRTGTVGTGADAASSVADCLVNEIAISGGCACTEDSNPDEAIVRWSQPWSAIGGSPTSWGCGCQRRAGSGSIRATAHVVCCF